MNDTKTKIGSRTVIYKYTIDDLKQLFADECGVDKEHVSIKDILTFNETDLNRSIFGGIEVIVKAGHTR